MFDSVSRKTKNTPPIQVKKQCYVCFCSECGRVFEVANRKIQNQQKLCSMICVSINYKKRKMTPTNKIHANKKERTRFYYEKKSKNPLFILTTSVRGRVKSAIKNEITRKNRPYKTIQKTTELVGCDIATLKIHIETLFTAEMSWENWGKVWHIDHIFPISKVDIFDERMLYNVCNYKNLRPLLKRDNLSKHNKITDSLENILGENYVR